MTMANRPIAYTLKERKGTVGNLKGKIISILRDEIQIQDEHGFEYFFH